ncbi:hypothetical protein ACF0H5_012804 [Mactra antiquata]
MRNEDGSDLERIAKQLGVKCRIVNPTEGNRNFKACQHFLDKINADGSAECKSLPEIKWFISTDVVQGHNLLLLNDLYVEPEDSFQLPRLDPETVMVLFPTSGSTGESKFVPHTHHESMIFGYHLKERMEFEPDDVIYNERRMTWIGGFPYMLPINGVKVVTKTAPISSLEEHCKFTYDAIITEKCNIAGINPPTVHGMVDLFSKMSPKPPVILRNIHTGGRPVAATCMDAIGLVTEKVTIAYGSSEGGFFTFNSVTKKEDYIPHSSGRPNAGVELKVIGDDGFMVEKGIAGSIYVRTPCMMQAYFNNEAKTKEVFTSTRWMNTGDVGYITNDDQLVVNGRQSDIILQYGRLLIPSQIEDVIKIHPDVFDVVAVPVPDDSAFEKVCACVVPLPGRTVTPEDIQKFYFEPIMPFVQEAFSYDSVEYVVIFDEFPTLYTGKPNKRALKTMVLEKLGKA